MLIRIPLFFAFPLLTHLAVELQRPWLQCAALVCAFTGMFHGSLVAGRWRAWAGLAAFAAADLLALRLGGGAIGTARRGAAVVGIHELSGEKGG